jgi:hypothetical protein
MGDKPTRSLPRGLHSPPTHGVRRNAKRTTHATVPCEDCDLGQDANVEWKLANTERWYARHMADLERVMQQLHDSEINAGLQTFL